MNYKAIFFDRDGTLTYFTTEKEDWRDRTISEWSGKPFELPYEKMMDLFHLASEGRKPWYKTLQDEQEFFKRYYYHLLVGEGVTEDVENKAELLMNELWCNGDRALFSDTVEVLEYFKKHGYKMGVISDTSPSLEFTLQQLGIAKYFTGNPQRHRQQRTHRHPLRTAGQRRFRGANAQGCRSEPSRTRLNHGHSCKTHQPHAEYSAAASAQNADAGGIYFPGLSDCGFNRAVSELHSHRAGAGYRFHLCAH